MRIYKWTISIYICTNFEQADPRREDAPAT